MKPLLVEMTFDFICPWCLIGKRNLEKALGNLAATRPDVAVELRWKGVQLLPDLPAQGVPFMEFYLQRLGSEAMVRARQEQVREAAYHADVDVDLQRIVTMPNTANAHRLLALATEQGSARQVDALLERLFASYFQKGEDIGSSEVLLRLARQCGFDPRPLEEVLFDDGRPYVGREAVPANQAVPSFTIDERPSLAGAQPPWLMLAQLQRALELRPLAEARRA
ncbi:DSBA oxidoreductase [Metapseudomonas resinovorans]|uniref:DsbA family oxidoreductase n=1 Tax=Metapseudomonas resinovorans TaxID=53412 RepID=UPI00098726A2|nr:DsbA family oxidoreductase [Pseudomonas resinovorans]GLZ87616.1 DSBA oxidoreductase [Pseudomonas resinovorans]